mmetsp:Transcript_51585/g.83682  ORF Transcript_51585/g.83682 Transcript_51585/m.83682 type:complete len:232 (-) Transcript_51585:1485-2180(-)
MDLLSQGLGDRAALDRHLRPLEALGRPSALCLFLGTFGFFFLLLLLELLPSPYLSSLVHLLLRQRPFPFLSFFGSFLAHFGLCVLNAFILGFFQLLLVCVGNEPLFRWPRIDRLPVLLEVLRLASKQICQSKLFFERLILHDGIDVLLHSLNLVCPLLNGVCSNGPFQNLGLNLAAALLAKCLDLAVLLWNVNCHSPPRFTHSGRSANTMDITGDVHGQVKIDDSLEIWQI